MGIDIVHVYAFLFWFTRLHSTPMFNGMRNNNTMGYHSWEGFYFIHTVSWHFKWGTLIVLYPVVRLCYMQRVTICRSYFCTHTVFSPLLLKTKSLSLLRMQILNLAKFFHISYIFLDFRFVEVFWKWDKKVQNEKKYWEKCFEI